MIERFTHPAWRTAAGTAAAYVLLLVVAFFALFAIPYGVFVVLGG